MDLASELSEYAMSLRYADLSEHAVHTAKQRLIDSLGCGLGAFAAVPVRNGRAFARAQPLRSVHHFPDDATQQEAV